MLMALGWESLKLVLTNLRKHSGKPNSTNYFNILSLYLLMITKANGTSTKTKEKFVESQGQELTRSVI